MLAFRAGLNPALHLFGMGSAAMAVASGSQGANVTAGGYTPLPLPESCAADSNCDPTRPTRPELTEEQKAQRDAMIDLIRTKNPYQLSRDGLLFLPGFAPIPLAGLTEHLATLRLGVEPALRDLFVRVTKLPLTKEGLERPQAVRLRSLRPSALYLRAVDQRAGARRVCRRPGGSV